MALQLINLGSYPNSRDGDPARAAFDKINENFLEVYGSITTLQQATTGASLVSAITEQLGSSLWQSGGGEGGGGGSATFDGIPYSDVIAGSNIVFFDNGDNTVTLNVEFPDIPDVPTFNGVQATSIVSGTNVSFANNNGVITINVATGTATVGDADYGNITVSGSGSIWTVDAVAQAVVTAHQAALTIQANQIQGLGNVALLNIGTGYGTVAEGYHTHTIADITDYSAASLDNFIVALDEDATTNSHTLINQINDLLDSGRQPTTISPGLPAVLMYQTGDPEELPSFENIAVAGAQAGIYYNAGDRTGSTIIDHGYWVNARMVLTGNWTLNVFANARDGADGRLKIDNTGGYDLTLGTNVIPVGVHPADYPSGIFYLGYGVTIEGGVTKLEVWYLDQR